MIAASDVKFPGRDVVRLVGLGFRPDHEQPFPNPVYGRLVDNRLRIHPPGGSHAGGDQIECPTINKTLNVWSSVEASRKSSAPRTENKRRNAPSFLSGGRARVPSR